MKKQLGFTLLELMVVVAVIAILAAIALSSYRNQLIKSKRAEAKQTLSDLALKEEKWRLNNATYTATLGGTATTGLQYFGGPAGASNSTPSAYYSLAITTPSGNCLNGVAASSGNSFRITATAIGDQAEDSDCATIVLTSLCGTVQKTSTPVGNSCW
jgi:type IV pilus assembly protein PilE